MNNYEYNYEDSEEEMDEVNEEFSLNTLIFEKSTE